MLFETADCRSAIVPVNTDFRGSRARPRTVPARPLTSKVSSSQPLSRHDLEM
jgi:hypothetical protein